MNPEQSVIDSIDALIDEQLDAGEPIGGYDYDDPDYPDCPRCPRQWHGLPEGNCIGSGVEGPTLPPCPHCGHNWHSDPYGLCEGSTFIGPRVPTWSERVGVRGASLWDLPDNPLDATAWFTPETPTISQMIHNLITMMGDLAFTARRWLPGEPRPYQQRRSHEITYSITDELSRVDVWPNPLLPSNPFQQRPDPRPWRWVPRTRVIPAYTVKPGPVVKTYDGEFRCTSETRNLRITGTVPELADATLPTLEPVPRWATDAEQLRWALTHPTIPDGRPYTYGRDFHIGVGARVGWDNGDGNVWIGTVTEEPKHSAHGWSITLGGQTPAHAEPPVGEAVQTLADYWRRRDSHQQPPMWTVNPARSRRANTRRRHR